MVRSPPVGKVKETSLTTPTSCMVRWRRSTAEAAARVVIERSRPTGAKVGATGGAPSPPASSSTAAPVSVTSHARSTCIHMQRLR